MKNYYYLHVFKSFYRRYILGHISLTILMRNSLSLEVIGTKDKINLGKLTMLHIKVFGAKKKHELKELLGFVLEVKRPM